MKRLSAALSLLGLVGCSGGECIKPPCVPLVAVTLHVRDLADGGLVSDPVANGRSCGSGELCIPLQPDGGQLGAGTVFLDVTAPGYGHAALEVEVPAAKADACTCQPGFVPQTRDVALTHL